MTVKLCILVASKLIGMALVIPQEWSKTEQLQLPVTAFSHEHALATNRIKTMIYLCQQLQYAKNFQKIFQYKPSFLSHKPKNWHIIQSEAPTINLTHSKWVLI